MRLAICLALAAGPAAAQDFSASSEARSWNLAFETPARFEAKVVDPLCELTGDCPAGCGGGDRQLALLRSADGVLVYPTKNGQPLFTGAARELLPFCGQEVEVDGLMIEDEYVGAVNIYQLQRIRAVGDADWTPANRWTDSWAEQNPDIPGDGPWFRRDPRVNAAIEADGWLGLGPEIDEAFLEEWF